MVDSKILFECVALCENVTFVGIQDKRPSEHLEPNYNQFITSGRAPKRLCLKSSFLILIA